MRWRSTPASKLGNPFTGLAKRGRRWEEAGFVVPAIYPRTRGGD